MRETIVIVIGPLWTWRPVFVAKDPQTPQPVPSRASPETQREKGEVEERET